eukprot:1929-Eustigmatos_ZCMA.PRE.1
MKLIPEWRQAHKLDTVRLAALLFILSLLQAEVLPLLQAEMSPRTYAWVGALFGMAIGLLRYRLQPEVKKPEFSE